MDEQDFAHHLHHIPKTRCLAFHPMYVRKTKHLVNDYAHIIQVRIQA